MPKAELKVGSKVFNKAARQKSRMNHGHWIRALLFRVMAVTSDRGTIHNARASLIVVPTASATGPYLAVAPTTELVSWMASADHRPNCTCVMCKLRPTTGNRKRATELR